jgi:hypothetical protein
MQTNKSRLTQPRDDQVASATSLLQWGWLLFALVHGGRILFVFSFSRPFCTVRAIIPRTALAWCVVVLKKKKKKRSSLECHRTAPV